MIFDDLFYPGNPQRRQQVANLRAEIVTRFDGYKTAWNDNAELLTGIFATVTNPNYAGMKISKLSKDIHQDTVGDCINEINTVLTDTTKKLDKLVEDIGLNEVLPPNWKETGVTLDSIGADTIKTIGQTVSGVLSAAASAFVGYYVFTGVTLAMTLARIAAGTALTIGTFASGALAGALIGGAVFVITDLIASAITGAIERKELNEAIDALTKLHDAVKPLSEATVKLAGVNQSIKDSVYCLDNEHILMKLADGSYVIISTAANTKLRGRVPLSEMPRDSILFLSA